MPNSAIADGRSDRGAMRSCAVTGAHRKTRSVAPAGHPLAAEPDVLVERALGKARRVGQRRRRARENDEAWQVLTDLPDTVPITATELAALEQHLGAAITAILSGKI